MFDEARVCFFESLGTIQTIEPFAWTSLFLTATENGSSCGVTDGGFLGRKVYIEGIKAI